MLDSASSGWYSVRTTDPREAAGEQSRELSHADGDEIPQQMSDALAHGEDAA